MKFDIHLHTSFSPCGEASVDEMINAALEKGLDGICITDHQTMEARLHINEGPQDKGLVVIIGMEYSTRGGDFIIFGPFDEIEQGLTAEELLYYVSEADGIAVAAHPLRAERPVDPSLFEKGLISVIESVNSRNTPAENAGAEELLEKYDLKGIAVSDAHSPDETGKAITIFHKPVLSTADLVTALRSGSFSVEHAVEAPAKVPLLSD